MTAPKSPEAGFDQIFASLTELLHDVNEDWETAEIKSGTRLVELGLESISLVYLIAELQQMYGLGDRLFRKMRDEGSFLKDMTIGDIVNALGALIEAH
jgi:hypothetical protein